MIGPHLDWTDEELARLYPNTILGARLRLAEAADEAMERFLDSLSPILVPALRLLSPDFNRMFRETRAEYDESGAPYGPSDAQFRRWLRDKVRLHKK